MNINLFYRLLLKPLLALLWLLSANAFAAGVVTFVTGPASIINAAGELTVVAEKMRLNVGDTVVTGKDGEVHIITDDRGLIALRGDSRVRIDEYTANGDAKDRANYTVLKGFLRSVTGWIGKTAPQNYKVRVGNATVGIRGTDHEVGFVEKGEGAGIYSKVDEGETTLGTPGGEISVKAGRAASVEFGRNSAPRLLDRIPPIFRPSANEKVIDATKQKLAADVDEKLRQRREQIKRSGGSNGDGNTRINEACLSGAIPIDELMEFVRAYENGDLSQIQKKLDPAMLGLARFVDGLIQDFNRQKQIRLFIKDIQVQCGPDLATVNFTWEKRFLDVASFAPGFVTGRGVALMHRGTAAGTGQWRIAGFAGDNPFSSRAGTLGQLTFGPAFSLATVSPVPRSVPVTVQVVDSDLAGLGSLTVQIVSTLGDAETIVLPETSPGRFSLNALTVSSAAPAQGNGILEVAPGVQLTLRYVDQNPGNNLPPTMLTAVIRPSGSLLFVPDTTPDPFSFAAVSNAATSTLVISNVATISGINAPSAVSIVGGEYAIDSGAFTGAGGTVANGQQVRVRVSTQAFGSTPTSATLNVGGVQASFTVTTAATVVLTNTIPNPFMFNSVSNAALSQSFTSIPVIISGITAASQISIVGGTYSINGGAFTAAPGTISNGQSVVVRVQSSSSNLTIVSATLTVGGVSGAFSVTTLAVAGISTPNAFSYPPRTDVSPSTLIDTQPATISGINIVSPVTIVGGQYSINGGAFTAVNGTISNGQTLAVRVLSSAQPSTTTSATVNVGGVSAIFSVTTAVAVNTVPNAFTFNSVSNAALSMSFTSIPATISGINAPSAVTISGGTYSINGGAFTAAPGTISNGQSVVVQVQSSSSNLTTVSATLTVGGVSGTFSVTTLAVAGISTPNAFSYPPRADVSPSTLIDAQPATISGINIPSPVTIAGGQYSINGGAFTAVNGTISNGQTLAVRVLSSAQPNTTTSTTVNVGGVSATFSVTTAVAINTVPNAFTFNSVSNAALSMSFTSIPATISGINAPSPISISGGTYAVNGGAFTAAPGAVSNGQTVVVQLLSSSANLTTTSATLNVGGVTATFSVTTAALIAVSAPNAFSFLPRTNVAVSTPFDATPATITGINVASPVSIVGGQYSINGGAFTAGAGTVTNGQTLTLRVLSSALASTTTSATVNVGGVTATFSVTTGVVSNAVPTPFSYSPVANAGQSTLIDSSPAIISGINTSSPVSIVGGQYSVGGGAFTSAAGLIMNGQTLTLRVLSAGAPSATTSATVTVGGVSATFSVTTAALVGISTPNAFSFVPQNNVPLSTLIDSPPVIISGINVASPVTVFGGQYAINGGAFTAGAGSITNGQTLAVRVLSSASFGTSTSATVNVGGVAATFTVTTERTNSTPNAFSFTPQTNVPARNAVLSNVVIITGINSASPVSIVGGLYAINGGAFTAAAGSVTNNQTIVVQLVASVITDGSGVATATLTVGGVSATFTVTTADTTPNAFAFFTLATTRAGVPSCALATSQYTTAPVTITGLSAATNVSVVASGNNPGAALSINGGAFTTAATPISNGQTVTVRVNSVVTTTGPTPVTRATVSIGGVSANVTQTCQ